jgi:hypothetical protein
MPLDILERARAGPVQEMVFHNLILRGVIRLTAVGRHIGKVGPIREWLKLAVYRRRGLGSLLRVY